MKTIEDFVRWAMYKTLKEHGTMNVYKVIETLEKFGFTKDEVIDYFAYLMLLD
jgi:hypothetical protein